MSAFNGFMSVLSVLVFSGHETLRMWIAIYLPATLLMPAAMCLPFPRLGVAIYALLLATSSALCAATHIDNMTAWSACADNLRFDFAAGGLLLISAIVPWRVRVADGPDPAKD
jgi:hypothetical protein